MPSIFGRWPPHAAPSPAHAPSGGKQAPSLRARAVESASLAVVTPARVQMQQLRRLPLCVWEMPGSVAQPSEVAQRLGETHACIVLCR
eukprot:CAMPEP_0181194952 /NCGR_PEP_ID=MMETSP1096-20121128/14616_1 /TAXON_ID=156174 ORGANISM="Chrysochromulina ericina, Strain CCMP281" /NCGR_SAMPLE_ID=MMETSP1096 /ASSEMBLY_ACC=CAM_ASM_000453 /LENGTH=87 /DNA_ID=CAMNT_0023284499 /DNA_START=674 /DNA_END=938 /DNA_ORIENTATION=+